MRNWLRRAIMLIAGAYQRVAHRGESATYTPLSRPPCRVLSIGSQRLLVGVWRLPSGSVGEFLCNSKPQTSAPLHSGRVFGTLRGIVVQRLQRKLGEKFCVRKSAAGIRFQYRFANYVWATRKAKAEEQAVWACVWGCVLNDTGGTQTRTYKYT